MTHNRAIVHALIDALNARDEDAIRAHFAPDSVFLSARSGLRLEGRVASSQGIMAWLSQYRDGRLEVLREFYADDQGYSEWRFVATTINGDPAEQHGVDYYRFADGLIVERSSFRKF